MNYLYNGVELPALPEWDKEKYPYAYIYTLITTTYFYAHDTTPYWNGYGITFGQSGISVDTRLTDSSWGELYEGTHNAFSTASTRPFWTNFDLLKQDGSVYLAASDPIPVNPAPTLDPTALLMGWQVGNRIRGGA